MSTSHAGQGVMRVGAAVVEISPPAGTPMAGFAARTEPSTGVHDPLTVRALAVDDTCWITVDVCGLHEDTCTRIAHGLPLMPERVAITATHTHAGPCVMPGRLGGHDPLLLEEIVSACREATEAAVASQRPATLQYGQSRGVDVARNRRHPEREVDPPVQVATFSDARGQVLAWIVLYPCHPVVLGPENRLISGDYPAFTRSVLEEHSPGSVALFLPGTAGDINSGHPADASYTLSGSAGRTMEQARKIGEHVAASVLGTPLLPISDSGMTSAARRTISVAMNSRDAVSPAELSRQWEAEAVSADPGRRSLLNAWKQWAMDRSPGEEMSWRAPVSAFNWQGLTLVGLPGEPFLATTEAITSEVEGPVLVTGYTNGCPGYFPTADEYGFGGYEVEDAHRYYGMPAPFAPGSAETLVQAALELMGELQ
ncbi:neutral/alkaline non-lysosomal ceramidase N-terminal domain-containing protein [Arthrobacter sp. B2a2-09]|uniref:neutral/alkaline non-lysosomal ceramidase N-terminal domain-containing protein n=1 Tax=Arthrobacter sp. B2a2-09 TaxID=2952822 RepID=UPI0022CDB29B|nr:neutral/alkaline non-lysosomal ceramidase N-terminal domain-containing protein [Arthrobacter sp. B2a2-09]MCZ9882790.1 neutral/alkaline non-lysosomal ceramidase N-terminal domain-containing protein [Arthrobacter sp. B2a2-09]